MDGWVASWGGWLACLGYLPALRWVSVTAATAPDPGCTLTGRVAAATDPAAPRPALQIMDELVATAPAAAADVDTRVSITFDPALSPPAPATVAAAVTETGRALPGLESALGSCGVAVLGRARAADIAGAVRTAFDPAVRGEVSRLLAAGTGPALPEQLQLGQRRARPAPKKPGTATGTAAAAPSAGPGARPPATTSPPTCWPGWPHPAGSPNGSPCNTGRYPAAAAARLLENEVRAAEFRSEYSRRTRRDVTARDAHDHARARQAADEEAQGAGVALLGLYVTVTVTDPAQLARAVADTEAAAGSSKIRLQRMYRSQAAGFTATLPCGICLPTSPAAGATDPPARAGRSGPVHTASH